MVFHSSPVSAYSVVKIVCKSKSLTCSSRNACYDTFVPCLRLLNILKIGQNAIKNDRLQEAYN